MVCRYKIKYFLKNAILSVLVSLFWCIRNILLNDYFVRVELPCNPDVDVCFVSECDADAILVVVVCDQEL